MPSFLEISPEKLNRLIGTPSAPVLIDVRTEEDYEVLRKLSDDTTTIEPYRISEDDAKELVEKIPDDYAEQAKMKQFGYTSVAEKLSERFHMDIGASRRASGRRNAAGSTA